jgi:DNA-binding MurR/RpiR family transcriptional regulator
MERADVAHGDGDDFLQRIAAAQPALSPQMARLAAFVGERYLQAAFMSARKLAAAAGVSLATAVRFARLLGYPSYEALRTNIQERVNFDLTGVERLRTIPGRGHSSMALLRRVIEADVQSLRALAQTFSEPQFERFVRALISARRVTILGFRYVSPLATYFAYSLAKVKPDVQAVTRADSSLYDHIRLMSDDDLLVVIAFARYPVDLVEVARYARRVPRRLVAITDSALSPLLSLAEVTLFAKANMLDFVGSLAAPAALINCVVSEVGVRLGDRAIKRLQALEESAREAAVYVRGAGPPSRARGRAVERRRGRVFRVAKGGSP